MAITFDTSAGGLTRGFVNDSSSNTVVTISKPTNSAVGKTLIGVITSNHSFAASGNSITPPSGWTTRINTYALASSGAIGLWIGERVIDGTEGSSFSWTIGADTRDDQGYIVLANTILSYTAASTPVSASATSFTPNTLTTTSANEAIVYGLGVKNGTLITAQDTGNPTGTTLLQSKSSRSNSFGINSGFAYEIQATQGVSASRTWSSYVTSASVGTSASVSYKEVAAVIDTINGSSLNPTIVSGSNTITTTGLNTLTSVTVATTGAGSVVCSTSAPSGDGTFTMPWPPADTSSYPYFGSVTETATDGTSSATMSTGTWSVPSGYAEVTQTSVVTNDNTYLGYHIAGLAVNDRIYYPTSNGLVINSNGYVEASSAMIATIYLHKANDFKVYSYDMTINESGTIGAISLTMAYIATQGLTFYGLTSTSLSQV